MEIKTKKQKTKNQAAQQKDATGWFSLDLSHTARPHSFFPPRLRAPKKGHAYSSFSSGRCSGKCIDSSESLLKPSHTAIKFVKHNPPMLVLSR